MKKIHSINKWSFILTLLLYTTVIGGLLTQILLGCIQFILALTIVSSWKKLDVTSKKLITTYWILFISYWITYKILDLYLENTSWFIFFILIPMCIASYFVYATYRIKKCKEVIEIKPSFYN